MLRGILLFVAALGAAPVQAEGPDPLRKGAPIPEPIPPERIFTVEDRSLRRERAYPMQPPTIPHQIDHYQVDRYANKCLTCHSRHRVQESQAPMVSVTHYMNREGNFLAQISPRRYFCNQCHVPQTLARPLVANRFEPIDRLLLRLRRESQEEE